MKNKTITQTLGMLLIIVGGVVATYSKQPGMGGIIIAIGLWIGSLFYKK